MVAFKNSSPFLIERALRWWIKLGSFLFRTKECEAEKYLEPLICLRAAKFFISNSAHKQWDKWRDSRIFHKAYFPRFEQSDFFYILTSANSCACWLTKLLAASVVSLLCSVALNYSLRHQRQQLVPLVFFVYIACWLPPALAWRSARMCGSTPQGYFAHREY